MIQKFAVIGHPIGHTMSPFIHSRLFSLQQIPAEYSALDISPDSLKFEMNNSLIGLRGFNVTIPHKEAIIPFLDGIDASASKYNAVNCVLRKDGKTYGCSTDAYGFTKALEASNIPLAGRVLVVGAGGAGRTLAREACDAGCLVTVAGREKDMPRAERLKRRLIENGGKAEVCLTEEINGKFDLCVNATPVGMYPHTDGMILTEEQLKNCTALFDAVYNPEKTQLIKTAEKLGIKTVGGMAMLVWQAVKAHEFWYSAEFNSADVEQLISDASREMARIFYEK